VLTRPKKSRAEIKGDALLFIAIAVDHLDQAIEVAKEEVQKGAQLIELCGAFGVQGAQKIIDAIGNTVPVGNVSYSLTDIHKLLHLIKDH
jgi:cobalamin-dependent methionine synthase I